MAGGWRRKKWVFGMLGVTQERTRPILRLVERTSQRHLSISDTPGSRP